MRRVWILFVFLAALNAGAQMTTVNLTGVTDSDATIWRNGNWQIDFNPNPNTPGEGQYFQNGVHLNSSITHQKGVLDNSGNASMSVYDSSTITPVGSGWKITVCPNAVTKCGVYTFNTSGSAQNITANVNAIIPAPRFIAAIGAYGYNSTEAQPLNIPGATYWDVTQGCQNFYNTTTGVWACTSASGAIPAGPAFAVNFANSAVSNFQGDFAAANVNPITHTLTSQILNGIRNAASYQTGGGNNGIANALGANTTVIADPTYSQTEATPWGGVTGWLFGQTQGPSSTDFQGGVTDYRYGVLQTVYNSAALQTDNRHTAWPSIVTNFIGNSGLTGIFNNPGGALFLANNYWHGGVNFYNDKTNMESFAIHTYKWSEVQTANLDHNLNCYANGDCLSYAHDTFAYGGPVTVADESLEDSRGEQIEAGIVFHGTVNTVTVGGDGSTTVTTSSLVGNGTQGEGRILIKTNSPYNTGRISSITVSGGVLNYTCDAGCDWDGTYGLSTRTTLTTAVLNPVSGTNSFPQTNTVLHVSSSSGFTVGNVACIFDYDYECEKITATGSGTITIATDRKPHPVGTYIVTGGMTGYAIELEADRMDPADTNGMATGPDSAPQQIIRHAVPIMYNSSGNALAVFQSGGFLPGTNNNAYYNRAYTSMSGSGGTCTPTVAGGILTGISVSGGTGFTGGPPQIVFTGTWTTKPVAQVGTWFSGGVGNASVLAGGSGIAGGLTCSIAAINPYDVYPAAKTVQVWDAASGSINGIFITNPWPVALVASDVVEQPHYFTIRTNGDQNHVIGNYQTRIIGTAQVGNDYHLIGNWAGGDRFQGVTNDNNPDLYGGYPIPRNTLGRNQLLTIDYMQVKGAFQKGLAMYTPPFAPLLGYKPSLLYSGCGNISCSLWTTPFYIFGNEGATQFNGLVYTPATETYVSSMKNLDLSQTNLSLGTPGITSGGGLITQQGQNWNPNSNVLTAASWTCFPSTTVALDGSLADPFKGNQPVWKITYAGGLGLGGCFDTVSTNFTASTTVAGNVWVYATNPALDICMNVANSATTCTLLSANTWTHLTVTGTSNVLNHGSFVYIAGATAGNLWVYNPVAEQGKTISASALVNSTATSVTADIPINQFLENLEIVGFLKLDGLPDGCLNITSGTIGSTGLACGSGGGGSMTWPTGGPGIPNYSGSSSWTTSYDATNKIPATFVSTLNQNTSGTAANLSGTPTLPNGTAGTTQTSSDNSTKLATTAFVQSVVGGVTGGSLTVSGGTLGATTCSSTSTVTDTGLTTTGPYSRVVTSYTSNPAALTGWGAIGGMELKIWASSANTATYVVCNPTGSSITYSSITFSLGAN